MAMNRQILESAYDNITGMICEMQRNQKARESCEAAPSLRLNPNQHQLRALFHHMRKLLSAGRAWTVNGLTIFGRECMLAKGAFELERSDMDMESGPGMGCVRHEALKGQLQGFGHYSRNLPAIYGYTDKPSRIALPGAFFCQIEQLPGDGHFVHLR